MPDAITLESYRAYLMRIANQHLRPDLRAKAGGSDLVQDTLVAAWVAGDRAPHRPDALRAWLRGILRYRIGRLHRRFISAASRAVGRERSLTGLTAEPWESPDEEAQRTDFLTEVARRLNRL